MYVAGYFYGKERIRYAKNNINRCTEFFKTPQ